MKHCLFIITFFLLVQIVPAQVTLADLHQQQGFDTSSHSHMDAAADTAVLMYDSFQVKKFNFAFRQNEIIYQWQNISSVIIFFVVILVVLTGLYLSYRQFVLGEKMLTQKREVQTMATDNATVTTVMNASLEMGKDGVKINTAVVGLVILIISLSFLFMYLKYVYPVSIIKEDFPTSVSTPAGK